MRWFRRGRRGAGRAQRCGRRPETHQHTHLVPEIKWFWIAFDAALCRCLFSIGRWRHRWLVDLTVGMVVFDAVSTILLSALIELPRISKPLEVGLFAIAITAPLLACAVLVNMRRRLRRHWTNST